MEKHYSDPFSSRVHASPAQYRLSYSATLDTLNQSLQMGENRPSRKKNWVSRLLTPSRPDHNLSDQSGRTSASASQVCNPTVIRSSEPFVHDNRQPSLNSCSGSQPVTNNGRSGLRRNIFKTRNIRSAGQSPHLEPVTSGASTGHPSSDRPDQVGAILTVRLHRVR